MAAKSKGPTAPPEKIAQFEQLIATVPEIELKGDRMPYTSVNGNMFGCLHPSGLLSLRLPEPERSAFLERYKTTLFEAYGIVQKEYVTVPEDLLGKTDELRPYLVLGFEYAKSLRPKPSKSSAAK